MKRPKFDFHTGAAAGRTRSSGRCPLVFIHIITGRSGATATAIPATATATASARRCATRGGGGTCGRVRDRRPSSYLRASRRWLGLLRHGRDTSRTDARAGAVVRDGVVVAVPAEEVSTPNDLPVATAVDEDREALLDDDDGDASPPPTQSDDALSALHAFLFGGPGAKSADHWRRVAAVVADLCGNQPVS